MCLFERAAHVWQGLLDTEYEIVAARKGTLYTIKLAFSAEDFPHLAGMQYARDVDFGLRPAEYCGDKLVPALTGEKMDGRKIEKSRNWPQIEGRLKAIINLPETLSSNFAISLFDPKKVRRVNCRIDAKYLLKNSDTGETYFVFLSNATAQRQYCKSAFRQEEIDYMDNQQKLTLLKTTKRENGSNILLFERSVRSEKGRPIPV